MADKFDGALIHKALCFLNAIEDGYADDLPDTVQVLLSEAIYTLSRIEKGE